MTTWYTSDHHFGHANIIKYCNRPFRSVQEMDRVMIERWNDSVRESDHVFVLGDFSFYNRERTANIAKRLKGTKTIVFGNHDKRQVQQALIFDCGWEHVDFPQVTEQNGFLLSHLPYNSDDKRKLPWPTFYGKTLLHGHVHNAWKLLPFQINVSVDAWDFRPVRLEARYE